MSQNINNNGSANTCNPWTTTTYIPNVVYTWPFTIQPVAQPASPAQCQPSEKKKDKDGCECKKCKEFYQYAEPNQDDGTLICYGCRMVW